jgi:hypothetical protein
VNIRYWYVYPLFLFATAPWLSAASVSFANNSQTPATCPDNNQTNCAASSLQFSLGSATLTLTSGVGEGVTFVPFVNTVTGVNDVWWGPFAADNMGDTSSTCNISPNCNGVGATDTKNGNEPIQGDNSSSFDFLMFSSSTPLLPNMTANLLGYNGTVVCSGKTGICPGGTNNDADSINVWVVYNGSSTPTEYQHIQSLSGAITGTTINFGAFATGNISQFAIEAEDGSFLVSSLTATAAPEPGTVIGMASGFAGLLAWALSTGRLFRRKAFRCDTEA